MRILATFLLLVLCVPAIAEDTAEDDPLTKARALLHTERHDEAVALLREIIETNSAGEPGAEQLVRVGQAQWLLDEDEQAVETITRAVALDPEDAWVRVWLGRVLSTVNRARSADAFREAVKLDPKYGYAWFGLAKVLSRLKENEEALEAILKAIEHGERYASAYFYGGVLLARAERIEEGVTHYRKAVDLDPKHANAHYNLGMLLFRLKKYEEALAAWRASAALDRKDLLSHAKVLRVLTALGRHEEAVDWRKKIYAVYDASEDPDIKEMSSVTIDEFDVDGAKVTVHEVIRREKVQLYTTIFYVSAPNDVKFRINLEPHAAAFLGGPKYVLGRNEGSKHTTYRATWMKRPTYPDLKDAVIRAIRDKLRVRSSSNAESGEVEVHTD